ncbi:MAG: alpha/beta hydrolase-fold protein [bacterium]|nr:alpha/beta hydrolase-fold protein [bacterium]
MLSKLPRGAPLAIVLLMSMVFCGIPQTAQAEEGFFKQRLREKLLQKLTAQPAPAANASVTDDIKEPGDYYYSVEHGGLQRMYFVHVPKAYHPQRPAPLLFAFHGGGGDMKYMAEDKYYGLVTKSEQEGFVIVFPNGYSNFPSGKIATWNAGTCCGNARDKNIDDVGFVRGMVAHITGKMNIAADKIYATGMSNGGMMSERLACEMSNVFKAIASVAGPDGTLSCTPSQPISILQIHAFDDDHVLFNGGAGQNAFQDISMVTNFTSIPETVSRWVKRNHCATAPVRVLKVEGAYCDLYSDCGSRAKVKLCVTETGGHSWPGGAKPGGIKRKGPTSKAINADDEMWAFFKSLD